MKRRENRSCVSRTSAIHGGRRENRSCVCPRGDGFALGTSAIHGGRRENRSCVSRTSAIHGGRRLQGVYRRLHRAYGPQRWWPADSAFEIMVGAILTQNTAWVNVERAIVNLKTAGALDPGTLAHAPHRRLAAWLKPSGYFNIKARRVRAYCNWYLAVGGRRRLARLPTASLREALLAVHGVGPETADDILLYAFSRPVFVIDAYTRRLFRRLGLIQGDEQYETIRAAFEQALGPDVALFNEYHALIVAHAKDRCRPKPRCTGCCLARVCPSRDTAQ